MTRIRIAILVSFALLIAAPQAAGAEQPNFVIFIADDMGWDDNGPYGHPHIRTPNMDRLAREGLRLDRAFLTISSCSPSRASIFTSRYPHNTGSPELHQPLPADQLIFTTLLREAGYWTASVGKWHQGEDAKKQFDFVHHGVWEKPEILGGLWAKALRDRPAEKPFFLWAAAIDPHRVYSPGAVAPPHTASDVIVPPYLPDIPEMREELALYYDEITRFDEHVGLTIAELERQGLLDNTFVLLMSDNGRPFPQSKTRVNNQGLRTPMLVRHPPLVAPGTASSSLVCSLDIAPTILELAGIETPASFQGRSFVPVLKDPTATVRTHAFAEHNWHCTRAYERAVVTTRHCYIRNWLPHLANTPPPDAVRPPSYQAMIRLWVDGKLPEHQSDSFLTPRPREELFDLGNDPHCMNNLANDPAHREVLTELRTAMNDWRKRTSDDFPGETALTPDRFDRWTGLRFKE